MSLPLSRIRVAEAPLGDVAAVSGETGLGELASKVLVSRGMSPESVGAFLAPRLSALRPPHGMADLDRALVRLAQAISADETIGVFGDYDVDGVTSAAVLTEGLRALGGVCVPQVASRFSGYGLSPEQVERFSGQGCTVLVVADCGTSDHPALERAKVLGIDVVVIDHHQVPQGPSPAFALINPHRADDDFPFAGMASCGLAFFLIASLRRRLKDAGHGAASDFDPRRLLDLVALGTVADQVPLVDENRLLVATGLKHLSSWSRPGLAAMAEVAGWPQSVVSSADVGFRFGPRLNAAGRLGLLTTRLRCCWRPRGRPPGRRRYLWKRKRPKARPDGRRQ